MRRLILAIGALLLLFSGGCAIALISAETHISLEDALMVVTISAIGWGPGLAIVLGALYLGRPRT